MFSIYAATSAGEGPQYDGEFFTREDSELFTYKHLLAVLKKILLLCYIAKYL